MDTQVEEMVNGKIESGPYARSEIFSFLQLLDVALNLIVVGSSNFATNRLSQVKLKFD